MGVYTFDTTAQLTALGILLNLSFNTTLVKEIHEKGGTLYVLNQLFESDNPEVKATAAELLHRLMNNPSQGPSICEVMRSYLPNSVINGLKEGKGRCRNRLNWNKEQAKIRFQEQNKSSSKIWLQEPRDGFSR